MFNSKKLLTIVFVVLFLALLAEVGYIAYSTLLAPSPTENNGAAPTSTEENTAPVLERQGEQAIKDNVLNALAVSKVGVLKTSTVANHYEGKIIELENKIDDPIKQSFKIVFQAENGNTNGFVYNLNEVTQKLSVLRFVESGQLETITIDDLKVGDSISLDQSFNLLDDDLSSFVIDVKITLMP